MKTMEEFKGTPLGDAILELNQYMEGKDLPSVELNVVGGFAMMLYGYREENAETDIDYVGIDLPLQIQQISSLIGQKHGLGTDWINNDLMLSGISLEDFELSTGKLHFTKAIQLGKITVNVIDEKDLLRLKLIALDTALTAVELGGDFSRMKDIPDVIKLLEGQNKEINDAIAENSFYVRNKNIPTIIDLYKEQGKDAVSEYVSKQATTNIAKLYRSIETHHCSPIVDQFLIEAFERAKSEPDFGLE